MGRNCVGIWTSGTWTSRHLGMELWRHLGTRDVGRLGNCTSGHLNYDCPHVPSAQISIWAFEHLGRNIDLVFG